MHRMLLLVVIIGGLLVLPVQAGAATPAAGAGPAAFGAPETVAAGGFYWGMDMGVDAGGHVHLVAAGFRDTSSGVKRGLWYATDRSGSWVIKRIVRWTPGVTDIHPSLAVDSAGRVHIAVERVECVECSIAAVKGVFYLTDQGRRRGTFGTPTRLTPTGTAQPSLRVDAGHLFLAFAGHPDLAPRAVRLLTDASGRWTTSTIAAHGKGPFLRIGADGRPRVAFSATDGIHFGRARTLTGSWVTEALSFTGDADGHPVLSMDELGAPHIAWLSETGPSSEVRYTHRASGSWTAPRIVADATQRALSVDKPAKPWVVTGGEAVAATRPVGGAFTPLSVDAHPSQAVAVKVLDSGRVVVAWVGGEPFGLWVRRT